MNVRTPGFLLATLSLAFLLPACVSFKPRSEKPGHRVFIEPFGECVHVSNGTVQLVVSPRLGRIVGFGWTDGENLLRLEEGAVGGDSRVAWSQVGGSWPSVWPEGDWERIAGRSSPPPLAPVYEGYDCKVGRKGRRIRLVSPVIASCGLRVVREIRVPKKGAEVRVSTSFQRRGPKPDSSPWLALWIRTALRGDGGQLFARTLQHSPPTRIYPLERGRRLPVPERLGDSVDVFQLGRDGLGAFGMEADLLALRRGNTLLVQEFENPGKSAMYRPGERAQVRPLPGADTVEIGFTGPVAAGSDVRRHRLSLVWSLVALPPDTTPGDVAETLESY
jgi:hypothetical protein